MRGARSDRVLVGWCRGRGGGRGEARMGWPGGGCGGGSSRAGGTRGGSECAMVPCDGAQVPGCPARQPHADEGALHASLARFVTLVSAFWVDVEGRRKAQAVGDLAGVEAPRWPCGVRAPSAPAASGCGFRFGPRKPRWGAQCSAVTRGIVSSMVSPMVWCASGRTNELSWRAHTFGRK